MCKDMNDLLTAAPLCGTAPTLVGEGTAAMPSQGDIMQCPDGDIYQVVEAQPGTSYSVWVLKGLLGHNVRVGWNNQLPATNHGVDIHLLGASSGGHEYYTLATENGECGVTLGQALGGYEVKVDFAGLDFSTHCDTTWAASVTLSAEAGGYFGLGIDLAKVYLKFGVSATGSVSRDCGYESHGTSAEFDQQY
jgi:hypothetical protein